MDIEENTKLPSAALEFRARRDGRLDHQARLLPHLRYVSEVWFEAEHPSYRRNSSMRREKLAWAKWELSREGKRTAVIAN